MFWNLKQKASLLKKSESDLSNEKNNNKNLKKQEKASEINNDAAKRSNFELKGAKKAIIITIILTVGTITSINIANNYFKGKANLENVKTQEVMKQDNTDKSQTSDETPQTPEEVKDEAEKQKSGGESQQKKHEKVVKEIDESGKNMGTTYGGKSAKDVNTKDVYKKGETNTTTGSTQNDASSAKSAQEQKEEATKKAEEKANKSSSQVIEGNKGVVIQGEQPAPKTPTPSQDAPTTKSDVQEQQQQQQEAPKKKLGDAIKQREQNQQNNDQQARNQIEMEIE